MLGVGVGVEESTDATTDEINDSLTDLSNNLEIPEIEEQKTTLSLQKVNISEPESDEQTFTQQIEILREFSPANSIPELENSRITAEMQSQLDELMITLNADNFISRFESILAGIGNNAVPQYSSVYSQIQSVPERRETSRFELPKSTLNSQKISIYIGDTEIKDFVITAIDEANAVSGGVTV